MAVRLVNRASRDTDGDTRTEKGLGHARVPYDMNRAAEGKVNAPFRGFTTSNGV